MIRRDTEAKNKCADNRFVSCKIYDLQGILKNKEKFKCGIEAYQVKTANDINFNILDQDTEFARFSFCKILDIPYYIVITTIKNCKHIIYKTISESDNKISFIKFKEFNEQQFIKWWRLKQGFTQTKPMYNAKSRIKESIIDNILFKNNLAWGVNIDGFMLNKYNNRVVALFEKRICTSNKSRSICNYDPNIFFKGTQNRGGDEYSWKILYDISQQLEAKLILLTFETENPTKNGASLIVNVKSNGLEYFEKVKPYENLLGTNLEFQNWLRIILS